MKVQKIESDKNDLFDKKEKIFSHEVENLKLQFIEEKEQLKENLNELSKEKEQIIQENLKLRDQVISERLEERKVIILLKTQMKTDKQKAIRVLENKLKCISEVKVEVEERMRRQSVRLNDTLEDNMKLKVELEKNDFDIKAAASGMEQKLMKKEEEILTKNNKLHSVTKKMESEHKSWTALEKNLRFEIKELKSSLNKSNVTLREKDETLKRIR